MAITEQDVKYIAELAKLSISPDIVPAYVENLSKILDLAEQMNDIDTHEIDPLAHPLDLAQRLREDCVTETDQHEKFQVIAPLTENDLYLVPKVIED